MNFDINGVNFHVEVCGQGFPLVALHGFTGNGGTWVPFCDRWGKHSQLCMLDIIGHGQSDSPIAAARYSITAAADDLRAMLDEIGVKQIDLLGYSMGGRLALTFALLYPERVRKLVLESSTPGIRETNLREERRLSDAKLAEFILEKGMESFVSHWEQIPLFSSLETLPITWKDAIREQRLNNSPIGLSNSLIGMGTGSQPSWWEELYKLSCEVLLVTGTEDEKFCRIAEKMLPSLKKGQWVAVENCGHIIHVEKSEKFGTIVSEFLSNT